MVLLSEVREGSVVMVRGGFGTEPPKKVVVNSVDPDIKNGRAGIDYDDRWAYLDQVISVIKY
jgi:hypothetical protein